MKMPIIAVLMLLALATAATGAEFYRWVDAEGRVHYTDTPPPANAKNIKQKKASDAPAEGSALPYSAQQAMKNFPVLLYVSDCGEACVKAREFLKRRGIPHAEKDSQQTDNFEALKKLLGGNAVVPVLTVGSTVLRGFDETQWNEALDLVGYPKSIPTVPRPAKPAETKPAVVAAPASASDNPVVLFNTDCGAACTKAREFLVKRGIPFTEKNAQEPAELEALTKLIGDNPVVPVLQVGDKTARGFEETQWNNLLDKAGYAKAPAPAGTGEQPRK